MAECLLCLRKYNTIHEAAELDAISIHINLRILRSLYRIVMVLLHHRNYAYDVTSVLQYRDVSGANSVLSCFCRNLIINNIIRGWTYRVCPLLVNDLDQHSFHDYSNKNAVDCTAVTKMYYNLSCVVDSIFARVPWKRPNRPVFETSGAFSPLAVYFVPWVSLEFTARPHVEYEKFGLLHWTSSSTQESYWGANFCRVRLLSSCRCNAVRITTTCMPQCFFATWHIAIANHKAWTSEYSNRKVSTILLLMGEEQLVGLFNARKGAFRKQQNSFFEPKGHFKPLRSRICSALLFCKAIKTFPFRSQYLLPDVRQKVVPDVN